MIDPRREAVLILDRTANEFKDRTPDISGYESLPDGKVDIVFDGGRHYPYRQERVRILTNAKPVAITGDSRVEVDGSVWADVVEVVTFSGPEDEWSRIFYRKRGEVVHRAYRSSQVRVLDCALPPGTATEVKHYWDAIVADLPSDDPLVRAYGKLTSIHPESVLSSYLNGAPIQAREPATTRIFPFRCNLSQRQAVENGLKNDVSVIEGPPGTGKTETILNLIANIVVAHKTVGVVSHANSAVDNVREKLDELGFGHVIASLGNKEKQERFFAGQDARNDQVTTFVDETPEKPDPDRLDKLDGRLRRLQDTERHRAKRQNEVDAYRLELRHFDRHLQRDGLPDLAGLPLLRRSSDRILDYLAESDLERNGVQPGLLRRIRKYFKYGSLRGLATEDTNVVLRLQRAYYDKRIAELDAEIEQCEKKLRMADFDQLAQEHNRLSIRDLHAELVSRYRGLPRMTHEEKNYKLGKKFRDFINDYPVVLSTCHSLRSRIADGFLLDYLIIDEASQVDPLMAGLALACCRNLVVVGDTQQLSPIPHKSADDHSPPSPAYDCRNSVLASLREIYGDALPSTLLREHYRCGPAIIGFCNKKFYEDKLIPVTSAGDARSMVVVRTAEGNHMRQHREGSRSNQREVDVIKTEGIPEHCKGVADEDIGVTTPYQRQVSKAGDALDRIDVKTVHKFQGRQKEIVVLTTVLDETWRGHTGMKFADDPRLINVAVSRAIQRFILVTNHDMMPKSRHIRDLVGYIRYHDLDDGVVDSSVISIFDLLYKDFSRRLQSLSRRLTNQTGYRSENIAGTVLQDILSEEQYAHLTVVRQVLVSQLLPDRARLTERQRRFVSNSASVDFVVYNRVTNQALLAIEVDGFAYHENKPEQRERDATKDDIFGNHDLPLMRLPTTGSREEQRIRQALDHAEDHWAGLPTL